MIIPACDEILGLSGEYDIIPTCHKVYADIVTPITLLKHIAERDSRFYLLESIKGGEKWGRYSSLRYNPVTRVICHCRKVKIKSHVSRFPPGEIQTAYPMDVLHEILTRHKTPRLKGQPPFTGGLVRYSAYAMIEYTEPTLHISRSRVNDFDLVLFDRVITYDHLKQKTQIAVSMKTDRTKRAGGTERGNREEQERYEGHKGGEDREDGNIYNGLEYLMREYGGVCEEIREMTSLISDITSLKRLSSPEKPSLVYSVSKEEFCDAVEETKEHILDGNILQAVILRQSTSSYEDSLLDAYQILRTTNPSPHMVYMDIDQDEITSMSPETLVRLENRCLTTFPIAGSRLRGDGNEEDRRLGEELLVDEKRPSEYSILMDLGRNDIGRIAEFEPVEVMEYKTAHKYSKITHICSQMEGDVEPGLDGCSAMKPLFPTGALSGAPRIQACEIVEKLEPIPHGIYGGALGYLNFTGNLDTCIVIRVAIRQAGRVTAQVGGGIVAGSVPELEYEESTNKAEVVVQIILQAGEVDDRWWY